MNVIEKELFDSAKELIEKRFPKGWGGAATVRTESGRILTSMAPDTINDALALCMEVGACLEAHKLNEKVTHSLCMYREDENNHFVFLSPCGICQERLSYWGGEVSVAVSTIENRLQFKTLRELMPFHWSIVNGKPL